MLCDIAAGRVHVACSCQQANIDQVVEDGKVVVGAQEIDDEWETRSCLLDMRERGSYWQREV
jgi:hypothetical protein